MYRTNRFSRWFCAIYNCVYKKITLITNSIQETITVSYRIYWCRLAFAVFCGRWHKEQQILRQCKVFNSIILDGKRHQIAGIAQRFMFTRKHIASLNRDNTAILSSAYKKEITKFIPVISDSQLGGSSVQGPPSSRSARGWIIGLSRHSNDMSRLRGWSSDSHYKCFWRTR